MPLLRGWCCCKMFLGETISIIVAVLWTACAMFAEVASKRMGSLPFNMVRMIVSLIMLGGVMWWFTGAPYPVGADADTWMWLALSGFVGYVLGDYCLFNAYILIGSRYGQLLMTLAPPSAAIFGFLLLGQEMPLIAVLGMCITITGIGLAIGPTPTLPQRRGSNEEKVNNEKGSWLSSSRGILFGIGAAVGQGIGLVLSAKGLLHYEESAEALGLTFRHGATAMMILPFASTAIRAIAGLVGFSAWTYLKGEMPLVRRAFCDRRAMAFALGAVITGPFLGVSLSLMATLYTATGIAQTIMATTPVLILLPTYVFFHQRLTWREVIGAVISVAGVALFFV